MSRATLAGVVLRSSIRTWRAQRFAVQGIRHGHFHVNIHV